MKKFQSLIALTLFILTIASVSLTGCGGSKPMKYTDYSKGKSGPFNKDLFFRNDLDVRLGDPTSFYVNEGPYAGYVYSSGTNSKEGFVFYRTKDFNKWEVAGPGFRRSEDNFGEKDFWAPQVIYDPDAKWSDYGVKGDGKGLYIMFYSANTGNKSSKYYNNTCYLGLAVSKDPGGPYTEYSGTNGLGEDLTAKDPIFNLEHINPNTGINLDKNAEKGQELYKKGRSFIDACPYIDPVSGDKYLYMARNRAVDDTNEIWGVKMIDWATPDYKTVTRLTSYGYTTTERKDSFNFTGNSMKIDEGPFCYYHEGKYYMTFSVGSTSDKLYPVCQAVSDKPLGPYTKIQPENGGVVCSPELYWDIHASGHHSFFEINDELFIVYHSYNLKDSGERMGRGQAFGRVYFHKNDKGETLMHANGPSRFIQPVPEAISGYKNLAPFAQITAKGNFDESTLGYLNDGLIKFHENDQVGEFHAEGKTTIKLEFKDYVKARALLVHNSYSYDSIFDCVEDIVFECKDKTKLSVKNLKFNLNENKVPSVFLDKNHKDKTVIRPGGAAAMEFEEIEIKSVTLVIKGGHKGDSFNISDIVLLGK